MKKIFKYFLMALFVIAFVYSVVTIDSPYKSEESIRTDLLNEIPLGTDAVQALKIAQAKGWSSIRTIGNIENGFLNDSSNVPKEEYENLTYIDENGEVRPYSEKGISEIKAIIGGYPVFLGKTSVEAHLVFDRNLKLINISIKKYTDSL